MKLGTRAVVLLAFALPLFAADSFAPGPSIPRAERFRVVADYNRDGLADVFEGNFVYISRGDSFEQRQIPELSTADAVLATADFNGDHIADLVTGPNEKLSASGAPQPLNVWIGNAAGGFTRTYMITDKWRMIGDYDGDGKDDLIYISFNDRNSNVVTFARSNGDGTFVREQNILVPGSVQAVSPISRAALGDFDRDGNPDLALRTEEALLVLPAAGRGIFRDVVSRFMPRQLGTSGLLTADIDGDGNSDIISVGSGAFRVLFSNGQGRFPRASAASAGGSGPDFSLFNLAIARFTSPTRDDLAVSDGVGFISIYSYDRGELRATSRFMAPFRGLTPAAGAFKTPGVIDVLASGFDVASQVFFRTPAATAPAIAGSRRRTAAPVVAAAPAADPDRLAIDITEDMGCAGFIRETWNFEREGIFIRDAGTGRTIDGAIELGTLYLRLDSPQRKWYPVTDYGTLGELEPGHWRGWINVAHTDCGGVSMKIEGYTK